MNPTKKRGVFSIPKCINPTKLNSKNNSKENKNEWNAIFNFQWSISKKEQEVPSKETNTQVWYKPQSDLKQTRF